MTTRHLTPVQRAYLLGLRRGRAQARRKMQSMLTELDDLSEQVSTLASDFHRYRSLEQAIETERDENSWLQ
jgi:hypothetical protein